VLHPRRQGCREIPGLHSPAHLHEAPLRWLRDDAAVDALLFPLRDTLALLRAWPDAAKRAAAPQGSAGWAAHLRYNTPLRTTEVLFTDRSLKDAVLLRPNYSRIVLICSGARASRWPVG
jgi:hypothetical protein